MPMKYKETDPVRLSDDRESIIIIDQSKLPGEVSYLNISTLEQMYDAIKTLAVRGAPCIGVFAGYCMALLADRKQSSDPAAFEGSLKEAGAYLESSRPTAVNLSWAVQRQLNVVRSGIDSGMSPDKIKDRLYDEAVSIHEEDISMCMRIKKTCAWEKKSKPMTNIHVRNINEDRWLDKIFPIDIFTI